MYSQDYLSGVQDFLSDKDCARSANLGDTVLEWVNSPAIDREWLKGYMDALIEYMQQNNLENI